MENYICINGKKAELTEEQMKALGIELPKKNPFARLSKSKPFYYITNRGSVELGIEAYDFYCNKVYTVANYCTDKAIMEQRALHEVLNRLLWRYSMENGGEGNYEVAHNGEKFIVQNAIYKYLGQTFSTYKVAENAIKEIIEPFMKAHPDFKF